jgi:hypothetical protein
MAPQLSYGPPTVAPDGPLGRAVCEAIGRADQPDAAKDADGK